ncbi:MAG: hypothetical protein MJE68_21260, partial [Proteobacteria bacterium]|nr:hypothetical protein [Pseudomonadota bacterium]
IQNHKFVYDYVKLILLAEYGHKRISKEEYLQRSKSEDNPLTEQEVVKYQKPGPFSFHSWLCSIIEPSFWGDTAMIHLFSMMWQVGITVLGAEDLSLTKIRHAKELAETDLVLVYAGRSHYLGACKYL